MDPESAKALVEHANRCWEAESKNADRIATRLQAVGAATLVLLGLGLFKFDWTVPRDAVSAVRWGWVIWTIRIFLIASILCFGRALFVLFPPVLGRDWRKTASYLLSFKPDDEGQEGHSVALKRTYKAYLNLQERNGHNWTALKRGEQWFGRGIFMVLLALTLYLVCSMPPKMPTEISDGTPTKSAPSDARNNGDTIP